MERSPAVRTSIPQKVTAIIMTLVMLLSAFCIGTALTRVSAADNEQVEAAVKWAEATASDDTHGYSTTNRLGNPDYDCSSFVSSAFRSAGFPVSICDTRTMRNVFTQAGFTWISWSDLGGAANLKRGDILLDEDSHVEIYDGDNKMVGAHMDYDGKPGDGDGREISVNPFADHKFYGTYWDGILRFVGIGGKLETEISNTVSANETISLHACAFGGSGNYQYKFIVYNNNTKQWYKIQDFSSSDTCNWNTGSAGNKTLCVDIKDSEGSVKRVELSIKVVSLKINSFSNSLGSASGANATAKLTASASGGSGRYTYKFIVHNEDTDGWYKIKDFSSTNNVWWNTGSAGHKSLFVDVRDSYGTVVRNKLSFVVEDLRVDSFKASSGPSVSSNTTTTLTCSAADVYKDNRETPLYYKFIVYNTKTGGWYKIRDYEQSPTCSWFTGSAANKILYVDVIDGQGHYIRAPYSITVK